MTRPAGNARVDTGRRRGLPARAARELDRIVTTTEATVQVTQQKLREQGELPQRIRPGKPEAR